jgi:cellulase/cellobiase CelA1
MAEQTVKSGHVQWVYQTYVNDDTAGIVADSDAAGTLLQVAQAKQAAAFAKVPGLSPETLRRLTMIRTGITTPALDAGRGRRVLVASGPYPGHLCHGPCHARRCLDQRARGRERDDHRSQSRRTEGNVALVA